MNICILVCHHKKSNLIKNDVFTPIQVGKAVSDTDLGILGDNSGDNISHLNRFYSELTATYWAWKNLDVEFIGICHYRRYFFNENIVDRNFKTERVLFRLKGHLNHLFDLKWPGFFSPKLSVSQEDSKSIIDNVANWFQEKVGNEKDCIFCLKPVKYLARTNRDLFAQIGTRYVDQLVLISRDVNPIFSNYIVNCLNSDYLYYANMVVMSKDLFNEYCQLMFTILSEHLSKNNIEYPEYNRVAGYMGEIITSAFIMMKKNNKVKMILMNELFVE
jgi:hypothetical protein